MPPTLGTVHKVAGPWSMRTSKRFWEGFAPSALPVGGTDDVVQAVFLCDTDWQRVDATITQQGGSARIVVSGPGDLTAATEQVRRFLSLDIDAGAWPEVALRDPVIARAQELFPGLRPCGFYSPYEAAVWAVLSQRMQMGQAATLKAALQSHYGDDGAFPAPEVLRRTEIDLPGRKLEYLHAVADAALDSRLGGARLRSLPSAEALREVRQITGLGPFAAELVVIRGANAPDVLPENEGRLDAEIAERYGELRSRAEIAEQWRPFRSWAAVNLRALRELRLSRNPRSRPVAAP
jgi:DNA-3-methyladenine glycosylase II